MEAQAAGVHLTRSAEKTAEIEALAASLGGRVEVEAFLDDLGRRARRALAPGVAVRRALTWDAADRRDPAWWPQGVSSSAEARTGVDGEALAARLGSRRLLAVAWYSKSGEGARISFLDLDRRRYEHVLLVRPLLVEGRAEVEPLPVHAGGLVWHAPYLHVAATARGFHSARLDDLVRVPDGSWAARLGYRYLLPVRHSYRAGAEPGTEPLRFSFFSADTTARPPALLVGEYGSARRTRRLARFEIDPATGHLVTGEDGRSRPELVEDGVVVRSQGAVVAGGRHFLTSSHGPWTLGSVHVGAPGGWRRVRWATPMGPEDLTWWPDEDLIWSASEHPRRRWVFAMRPSWLSRLARPRGR